MANLNKRGHCAAAAAEPFPAVGRRKTHRPKSLCHLEGHGAQYIVSGLGDGGCEPRRRFGRRGLRYGY